MLFPAAPKRCFFEQNRLQAFRIRVVRSMEERFGRESKVCLACPNVFNTGHSKQKGTEMKFQIFAALGILAFAAQVPAEEKNAFKDQKEKISYSIGINVGTNLKRQDVEVDLKSFHKGLSDAFSGNELLISQEESAEIMQAFQVEQEEKRKVLAEKRKQEGAAFLAENQKKPGVVTLPSGLQYKVLQEGSGPLPKLNDTVTTHYRGRFIDGREFDSSYQRGQPATFPVNRVVKGWIEALQLMPVGSKWELYIPADLAYGETGGGPVGPNATLIFEIELLSITPAVVQQPPQPITSDIIKVPSREELERGAKIEIIKPDQIEKEKARQR
jgi:FKBP-type peptidyl-prolyl cis-trans isomerase